MKTFIDDIRYSFLPRHGAVAEIIILNLVVYLLLGVAWMFLFLFQQSDIFSLIFLKLSLPAQLSKLILQPWSIITYAFVHHPINILHILFNLLVLYWFGSIYKMHIGNKHIWPTYIYGFILGGLFFVLFYNVFPVFSGILPKTSVHGASAGVNAILIATAVLVPNYTIYLLLFGPVKIKWVALFYVVLDVIFVGSNNSGGHIAHLGGALMGYIYLVNLKNGRDWSVPFEKVSSLFNSFFQNKKGPLRVSYRKKVVTNIPYSKTSSNKPTQDEVDRILDKLKVVGYEKLTLEEKQTLYRAGSSE